MSPPTGFDPAVGEPGKCEGFLVPFVTFSIFLAFRSEFLSAKICSILGPKRSAALERLVERSTVRLVTLWWLSSASMKW